MKDEASRLRIARAFRAAQIKIQKSQHQFICLALQDHHADGFIGAQKVIQRRLGSGCLTVNRWLTTYHPGLVKHRDMRKYRIAWLDALIKEFDPEGKTAPNSK